MDNHEIGILIFLALGVAIMFLPNLLQLRRPETPSTVIRPAEDSRCEAVDCVSFLCSRVLFPGRWNLV